MLQPPAKRWSGARRPAGVRQPHFTELRCAALINTSWPWSANPEPPRDRELTGGAESQFRAWIRRPKEKKKNKISLAFPKVRQTLGAHTLGHERVVTFVMLLFFPGAMQSVYLHIMSCLSAVIRSHYFQKAQHSLLDSGMPSLSSQGFIYLFWIGWFITAANRRLSRKCWQSRNYSTTLTLALLPLCQASPSPTS